MDWQTLRNQFMKDIGGDPPGAALEDTLIAAYTEHPQAVERSFMKIALAYKAGNIRSPWGALKTEVAKATDPARNPTHDHGTTKSKAVARAEQWTRTAGLHYDRETEFLDELYSDRGILHGHDDTQPRMLALWNELRPLGELTEHEAEERGQRYAQQRAALAPPEPAPVETSVRELIRAEIEESRQRPAAAKGGTT